MRSWPRSQGVGRGGMTVRPAHLQVPCRPPHMSRASPPSSISGTVWPVPWPGGSPLFKAAHSLDGTNWTNWPRDLEHTPSVISGLQCPHGTRGWTPWPVGPAPWAPGSSSRAAASRGQQQCCRQPWRRRGLPSPPSRPHRCQSDPPHNTDLGARLGQRSQGVYLRPSRASGSRLATPALC